MSPLSLFALVATAVLANAQSLAVINDCSESLLLFTRTSFGSIDNDVTVGVDASANMGISTNWDGAVNVGTGCTSDASSCITGGPTWDGSTPFSRAEFNFERNLYISLIYGYNVGMEISSADASCDAFACILPAGCWRRSPGGGGCVNNAGPGPYSSFYYDNCPNAYAFLDNEGIVFVVLPLDPGRWRRCADYVDDTCGNADMYTLTLCPGTTSNYS